MTDYEIAKLKTKVLVAVIETGSTLSIEQAKFIDIARKAWEFVEGTTSYDLVREAGKTVDQFNKKPQRTTKK